MDTKHSTTSEDVGSKEKQPGRRGRSRTRKRVSIGATSEVTSTADTAVPEAAADARSLSRARKKKTIFTHKKRRASTGTPTRKSNGANPAKKTKIRHEAQSPSQRLSKKQVAEYQEAFNIFDSDRDGFIRLEDLERVFKVLGQWISRREMKDMIEEVDNSGDGIIDLEEFFTMMARMEQDVPKNEELRTAFDMIDADHDGFIGELELGQHLARLGRSDVTASELIRKVDVNGDKHIDYEEFLKLMTTEAVETTTPGTATDADVSSSTSSSSSSSSSSSNAFATPIRSSPNDPAASLPSTTTSVPSTPSRSSSFSAALQTPVNASSEATVFAPPLV